MIPWSIGMLVTFVIGVLLGEVFDFIFDLRVNNKEDKYLKCLPWLQSIFHWFEHYHWGMFLLMWNFPLINGVGVSLILDENRSRRSGEWGFGYREPEKRDKYYHFNQSTAIGIMMLSSVISRWIMPLEVFAIYTCIWAFSLAAYAYFWSKRLKS
ncbi:MAG: hypothetical protein PVF58_21015 [Candidatus Methanofastidiosia archaeon]|jgi:hypothetical protein